MPLICSVSARSVKKEDVYKRQGTFHVRKENGRIYVDTEGEYDYDETVETLQRIFGIVGICPVVLVEDEGFDALAKVVCDYVDRTYPDKNFTFKVDARRARKNYPMTSMEINAAVGEMCIRDRYGFCSRSKHRSRSKWCR